MFIIKHRIQRRDGTVILEEFLPLSADNRNECRPLMEELAKAYDRHDYKGEEDEWWGLNDANPDEVHYWTPTHVTPEPQ